jgi:hypothetical protein
MSSIQMDGSSFFEDCKISPILNMQKNPTYKEKEMFHGPWISERWLISLQPR